MTLRSTLLSGVAILAGATMASGAFAQQTAANSTSGSVTAIGEVIVTARKREEDVQKVPVAITVQSGKQLQQQTIRQPSDLQRIVPSLVAVSGASSPSGVLLTLRGQSASDVLLTLSQPVGLYEDAVNIPHPVGADIGFFDLSSVEVLNGPQGTLYGRNTTGGAINILTRGADYDGFHGFISAEGGNFKDWKVGGAVNIPVISDMLSVRLAYQHWSREGFGESGITGERLGDPHDDDVARLSVKFDPNPAFTASLKLEYDHANRTDDLYQTRAFTPPGMFTSTTCAGGIPLASSGGLPSTGMYCPNLNGTTAGGAGTAYYEWLVEGMKGGVNPITLVNGEGGNIFTNYSAEDTFERLSAWHGALDWSWKINDDVTLRSITGFHRITDYRTFDLTALPIQAFLVGYGAGGLTPALGTDDRQLQPDEQTTQWTQEVNLSGTAFDKRLHWLLGGFYSHDSGNEDEVAGEFQGLTGFDINYHSPQITNESWAIFTQEDYKFTDMFSVTGGFRYTEEDLSQDAQDYIYFLPGGGSPLAGLVDCLAGGAGGSPIQPDGSGCAVNQSLHSSGISYLVSLNAQITPDVMAYLKTARGFRGGALQQRAPQASAAGPETNTDYEVGLKSDWFEHRLRANLDAYYTKYHNKQETQIVDLGGAQATVIENAAQAKIWGVEGQFVAVPFEGLTLNANFDYLHGSYDSFPNALTPDNTSVDASGVLFPLPQWTFDIGGRYVHDLGPGQIAFQADYSWHSATPQTVLDVDPTLKTIDPSLVNSWFASVGLVNARLEYNLPRSGLSVALFATNLLDKHYQTFALGFVGSSSDYGWTGQTQEPRMWGITIRKSFGPGE
jgi:iron complex outermembrane receptor protein